MSTFKNKSLPQHLTFPSSPDNTVGYTVGCLRCTCGRGVGEDGEGADMLRSVSCSSRQQCSLWRQKQQAHHDPATCKRCTIKTLKDKLGKTLLCSSLTWTTSGFRSCLFRGFLCLERKRSDCIYEGKKCILVYHITIIFVHIHVDNKLV